MTLKHDQQKQEPQILLTNDDGIRSPGLWAAAEALSTLGFVTVVAPRDQSSGAGRSMPSTSDGNLHPQEVTVNGKTWTVHAIGGTPAQAVLHGLLELMPDKPDLLVSGINYGLNVGPGVTISGTVGAALEGAAANIPSIAVSLDTDMDDHLSYSTKVDFSTAAFFTAYFADLLLKYKLPHDVDVLKIEVPMKATPETRWKMTRVSPVNYYIPTPPRREAESADGRIGYQISDSWDQAPHDSDVYTVHGKKMVAVTPLSLDMTSRVDLSDLESYLKNH